MCIKSALGYFLRSVWRIILKPPAVTLHHTLILGCNAGTLSSWVNFGGECWESSDPDSVLRSYISRQIKPGLPRGQQDEDSTYTTSHCSPNCTVMATPPLGQVLFNHHLNVPKCTFQSGTTLCCLEVPVTRQQPPKKFNWEAFQMRHVTKCDSPVCIVCLLCLWLSTLIPSQIFLGSDCRDWRRGRKEKLAS